MFSALFNRQPPLDSPSIAWIFEVYGWAIRHCSADYFLHHARLVLPTNDFFPGRSDNPQDMAELVFGKVAEYAGMPHWPWVVMDSSQCLLQQNVPLPSAAAQSAHASEKLGGGPLPVLYETQHVRQPEALIAGFAHTLAQYLGATATEPPPGGGGQNWPHITEVLATYMGFGLMFANSAFVFPSGGCSSCGAHNNKRENALAQWDCTYALALFCVLKGVPYAQLRPHLKKSLRGYFKHCVRDIRERSDELRSLQRQLPTLERVG